MLEIVRAKAIGAKVVKQRKVNFKSCPVCGDEILAVIADEKGNCDECEVPYVKK